MRHCIVWIVLIQLANCQKNEISTKNTSCYQPECSCCVEATTCVNGDCRGKCKIGYHGYECKNNCPSKCVRCTDHPDLLVDRGIVSLWGVAFCTECRSGYYSTEENYQCQHECATGCQTCTSATNCTSCVTGYFLDNALCTSCMSGCASCTSSDSCSVCKDGYYAITEGLLYISNCIRCSVGCSEQCNNVTGTCSCREGFTEPYCGDCLTGLYLLDDNCTQCHPSCKTCTNSSTVCTSCADGQFLLANMCRECGTGCAQCSSLDRCDVCQDGYYNSGTGCVACSRQCKSGQCDVLTGYCYCNTGYSGDKCDQCMTNFQSFPNCSNCIVGYYGATCERLCPKHCYISKCQRLSGACTDGCVEPFSGDMCNFCVDGRFGVNCSSNCPINCKGACDRFSGHCQTCQDNFSGNVCDVCVPGKHGTHCSMSCANYCKDECKRTSGICVGCKDSFYGDMCSLSCSLRCKHGTCEQATGTCIGGCISGYSGHMCCIQSANCNICSNSSECLVCSPGKYGETCDDDCPHECKEHTCNKDNGTCMSCETGFQGINCTQAFVKEGSDLMIANIVGGVSAAVIIIIGTAAVMIIFRKRISTIWHELTGPNSDRLYANDVEVSTSESPGASIAVADAWRQTQKYERKVAKYTKKLALAQNMLHDLKEKPVEHFSAAGSSDNVTFETAETEEQIYNDIETI